MKNSLTLSGVMIGLVIGMFATIETDRWKYIFIAWLVVFLVWIVTFSYEKRKL